MVSVIVPATTANLGPGFDTLGMALEIHNVIEMSEAPSGFEVETSGQGGEILARPENNLAYQAAQVLFDRVGIRPKGLRIRQEINIPLARGLGSSAAAIVGGLVAANALTGGLLGQQDLLRLAVEMEGHPDNVTPALVGGFTVACMHEGELLFVKIDPPAGLEAVVAIPHIPLSTKEARKVLPSEVNLGDAVFNLSRASLLVAALSVGRTDLLVAATQDRWHQPYREPLVPGLRAVFQAALEAGARGVALSGSGPSVIALVERGAEQVGRAMEGAFQWHGCEATCVATRIAKEGARVIG